MSAALHSLTSAAATKLYDAIGRAKTAADLDELTKLLYRSQLDGALSEDDTSELQDYIQSRRPVCRYAPSQETVPGFPLPERNRERVGRFFAKRKPQRRPDRQRSLERRKRLANSGVLPPALTVRLTEADRAYLRIVADEYRARGRCELTLPEIAARAGMCEKTAQRAQRHAQQERLISVQERPVAGRPHKSNVVSIISLAWLQWLRRPAERAGGGGHFCTATDTVLRKDDGGTARLPKAPPAAAAPLQEQPTKEAVEFARELAAIAGHQKDNLPKAWREADAPRLVQGWIDERVSTATLRQIAEAVMVRKRNSFDAGPPHSPLYFAPEIRKFVARRSAHSRRHRARRTA
jgi:hypothetical protein